MSIEPVRWDNCPAWCGGHEPGESTRWGSHTATIADLDGYGIATLRVTLVQRILPEDGVRDPEILISFPATIRGSLWLKDAEGIRGLAEVLAFGTDPRQADLASALRDAANILANIGGGS